MTVDWNGLSIQRLPYSLLVRSTEHLSPSHNRHDQSVEGWWLNDPFIPNAATVLLPEYLGSLEKLRNKSSITRIFKGYLYHE